MNKYVTFFEDILKILGAISIHIFSCRYIDIKAYYGCFVINISAYLSSLEILMSFFNNLLIVFVSLVILLFVGLYLKKHYNYPNFFC